MLGVGGLGVLGREGEGFEGGDCCWCLCLWWMEGWNGRIVI